MQDTDAPLPAPKAEATAALLASADRLLNDSETLLSAGGTASATSLATLAFEECGKLYALRFDLKPADGTTDLAKFHQAAALVGLCFAILRKHDIDQEAFYAAILPSAWGPSTDVGAADLVARLTEVVQTTLEPIMAGQSPERNAELGADVRGLVEIGKVVKAGQVGTLRAKGFQVETSGTDVVSDPRGTTRQSAERWAWAADGLFHLLQVPDFKHPAAQEVLILIEALGQAGGERRLAA